MKASGWLQSAVATTDVLSTGRALLRGQFYFSSSSVVSRAFSARATLRVFDVRASSAP